MRLFDFIEQQDAMRIFPNRFGQQSALIVADIARRRANQTRHGMLFHVFAHVEARETNAETRRKLLGDFGFAHARRPGEQKRADRFIRHAQSGAGKLNGTDHRLNRPILPEHFLLHAPFQDAELLPFALTRVQVGNMGDARDDLLDIHDIQHSLLLLRLADLVQRADFINHVNRLIRQKPLGDVPKRQLRRAFEGLIRVMNFVIFLETGAQAMQDFHRILNRRLGDVNFLKTPRKGAIMLEMAAVILMRRRADAAQIVGVQRVFQQAGSVH